VYYQQHEVYPTGIDPVMQKQLEKDEKEN
jgi:protein lifeguard